MLALAPPGTGSSIVRTEPVVWNKEDIVFSACNEDSRSDLRALGSLQGKDVFCVTAGGGRVLSLLVDQPRSIWAVDLNPAQNALLELKVAALRELDHDGYLRFLGVRADLRRLATYARLRTRLSDPARAFFDRRTHRVEAGVLYQGRLERYLKGVATASSLARPFGLQALLDARTLAGQRSVVARFERPLRAVAEVFCRRWVLRLFSGDPGFFQYLPLELPLHRVLLARVLDHLKHNLLRDNALLQLVFFGRYVWETSLPLYLRADTFRQVKTALERVRLEIATTTVEQALEAAGPDRFDAFSLSDISSYLDDGAHHRLFERVLGSARRNARLCSRSNLHHRPLSVEHACRVSRERALERELSTRDHSCVHEFVVGCVQ